MWKEVGREMGGTKTQNENEPQEKELCNFENEDIVGWIR